MATFSNQAALSYRNSVTNSNIVVGELQEALSATKTAVSTNYENGGTVTYAISLVNSDTVPYTGLTVTDNLGAYAFAAATLYPLRYVPGSLRYYVNGVLQTAPAVQPGPPMVITGVAVPAGGNALLVYEVETTEYAPLVAGSTVTNSATVTGAQLPAALTAAATLPVQDSVELTISKAISPATVAENGQLTYTFVIQNSGNTATVPADNVVVSDTFQPVLSDVTAALGDTAQNSTVLGAGEYSYSAATGAFSTTPGAITVPAATYTQDATGSFVVTPGVAVLTVTGTV